MKQGPRQDRYRARHGPDHDPDSYDPEVLLRAVALENAELRELLTAVAQDLERLAAHYPMFAPRFLARLSRLRARLWESDGHVHDRPGIGRFVRRLSRSDRTALATVVAKEREWRTAAAIAAMREMAGKGARELLRRLDGEPESIATRDLTVLTGVALDKLARYERWDEEGGRERGVSPDLAEILDALSDRGGRVEVAARVTVGNGGAEGERPSASGLLHRLGSGRTRSPAASMASGRTS